MNWERGIVTLVNPNVIFVATSHDQVPIGYHGKDYILGDCIELRRNENGRIVDTRRCERFVDFERKFSGISVVLICDVVDVQIKFVQFWKRNIRCFRTHFIEEVYDAPTPKTDKYSIDELIGSKVVIVRVPTADKMYSFWKITAISQLVTDTKLKKVSKFIKPIKNSERTQYIGWVCTYGCRQNGKDELYVWIPTEKHADVMFPPHLRNGITRDEFYGNWVTFSLEHPTLPDRQSDVRIIDDVFPTRKYAGRWEIKIPCNFRAKPQKSSDDLNLKLYSDICGNVYDIHRVLEKYRRFESFSEDVWVAYNYADKRRIVRFILSEKQDDWENMGDGFMDRGDRYQRRNYSPERSSSESTFSEESYESEECSSHLGTRSDEFSQPSTSSKSEPIENIRHELRKLEKKHQYLTENDLEVPKKLREMIGKLRKELIEYSTFKHDETELKKYRKLVVLFREMLSSEDVCERMRDYDDRKMEQILQLLF